MFTVENVHCRAGRDRIDCVEKLCESAAPFAVLRVKKVKKEPPTKAGGSTGLDDNDHQASCWYSFLLFAK